MIGQLAPETEWQEKRLGKMTASKCAPLFIEVSRPMTEDELKTAKENKSRKTTIVDPDLLSPGAITYIDEKVAEIITGTFRQVENFSTDWGKEHEPVAAFFVKQKYPDFEYYGKESPEFFEYSDWSGGSPDGVSYLSLMVAELKCPENPANHVAYLRIKNGEDLKKVEKDYWYQIQFNMVCFAKKHNLNYMDCTGLFVSFCPIVNDGYKKVHMVEIKPDLEFYNSVPTVIAKAERELKKMVKEAWNSEEN